MSAKPIVAATDGSEESLRAVDWAARASGGRNGGRGRRGSRTPARPGSPRRRTNGRRYHARTSHLLRSNRRRRFTTPA